MTTCLTCKHWNLRDSGAMAKQGFAFCNLGPRWQFFAPQYTCDRHEPAKPEAVAKRRALIKG